MCRFQFLWFAHVPEMTYKVSSGTLNSAHSLTCTVCSLQAEQKYAFAALGSQLVIKLQFRDVWAFVGQKGLDGASPIEQVLRIKRELAAVV